ncbi:MAG TPA: matrixin family metalloprotease, partial [Gemmataceae bacterium]|nr:matrixin family metalloprotease [Gemmataceae bacterium]
MRFPFSLTNFFHRSPRPRHRAPARRPSLHLEALETRLVPYNVSGYAWPHPQLVTLSFVPDGTNLGGVNSNLFAAFDAKFGSTATWQNQILKAAQVWAQQTNLNFSLVPDSGADIGSGNYQQGDPGFGDIRIGGFNFNSSSLAMAYLPPSINNYSVAGDIAFNTGQTFNIGSTYDLFTVATHEIGHALGLLHSDTAGAVMYATYSTKMTGLSLDDTAAIRNVYSNNNPRSADAFYASMSNGSFSAAADITSQINATSQTAQLTNL